MSYIRWSTKVVQDCEACGNEHFVSLPDDPDFLFFRPDPERFPDPLADDYPRLPGCCTSCWYIFAHVNGTVAAYHGRCPGNHDDPDAPLLHLDPGVALEWEPPTDCPMADIGREAVRECAADMIAGDTEKGENE